MRFVSSIRALRPGAAARPAAHTAALLAALALAPTAAAAQQPLSELAPRLEARAAAHAGVVGLALIDLATGESFALRGDEPFPTASVIKVPILVEVFHRVEEGALRLDDPLVMLEADKQPGAGILQHMSAPHQLTVADAAFLMTALSDNTATNLIIDKVGIRAVGVRMEALGLAGTRLHSKLFDRASSIDLEASARWGVGVTTPMEMARLFAMLYRGEAVSPEASERMLEMLRRQFYDHSIPRHLTGVTVAHKTGSISASRSDCGIVYAGGRDFVICAFTKENEDRSWRIDNEAQVLIAELARMAYQAFAAAAANGG
jgi:beta-lactamase class A